MRRLITLRVSLVAAIAAAAALPASAATRPALTTHGLRLQLAREPAAGRVLGGLTSQGWPVVMAISKNGKQVVAALAGIVMSCSSGQQFPTEDAWAKLKIGPNGSVRASGVIQPAQIGSGTSITGGARSFKGKLDRRTGDFAGVWHLQVSFTTSNGPDQCDSGDVAVRLRL